MTSLRSLGVWRGATLLPWMNEQLPSCQGYGKQTRLCHRGECGHGAGPGGPVRVSPQGSSEQAEKQQDGSRFHCGRKPWLPPPPIQSQASPRELRGPTDLLCFHGNCCADGYKNLHVHGHPWNTKPEKGISLHACKLKIQNDPYSLLSCRKQTNKRKTSTGFTIAGYLGFMA